MKNPGLPYRSRQARLSNGSHSILSRIATAGGAITVLSVILAGCWTLFEFFYQNYVVPRLYPAIVGASSELSLKSSSDCCHLYELQVTITNQGVRVVTIHASHFAFWGRMLASEVASHGERESDSIFLLNKKRSIDYYVDYQNLFNVTYQATDKRRPLLIAAGDIIPPMTHLAPKETTQVQIAAVVPKEYNVGSLRGTLLASHVKTSDVDWRWAIEEERLIPLPMPWLRSSSQELTTLADCIRAGGAPAMDCAEMVIVRSSNIFLEHWKRDSHSYALPVNGDFVVSPPTPPK